MTPTTPAPLTPVTLGLDVGTSGVKAVAVTAGGDTLAESTHSYPDRKSVV